MLFILLLALPASAAPAARVESLFSTVVTLLVREPGGESGEVALERCLAWCRDFDRRFTPGGAGLAPLEGRHAGETVALDPDLAAMLPTAEKAWRASGGLYDVTVGPLVRAYGFKTDHPGEPSEAERAAARAKVGFDRIRLDRAAGALTFLADGVEIDVGGLAKGYALDRAYEILLAAGVSAGLIDFGGDVRAIGDKGGKPWSVGVADPENRDRFFATLPLHPGEAVATSGDSERGYTKDGERFGHILDPRTGRPGRVNRAATVVATDGALAQSLSLAAFLMTAEAALAYCEAAGAAALVIDRAGNIHLSPRMKERCVMVSTLAARDTRFLALVFLLTGAAFLIFGRGGGAPARVARVVANGATVAELPLSAPARFDAHGPLGVTTVVVEGGAAYVAASPCPDKLCVRSGPRSDAGASIVCAPNGVAVILDGEPAGPDATTGK